MLVYPEPPALYQNDHLTLPPSVWSQIFLLQQTDLSCVPLNRILGCQILGWHLRFSQMHWFFRLSNFFLGVRMETTIPGFFTCWSWLGWASLGWISFRLVKSQERHCIVFIGMAHSQGQGLIQDAYISGTILACCPLQPTRGSDTWPSFQRTSGMSWPGTACKAEGTACAKSLAQMLSGSICYVQTHQIAAIKYASILHIS